LLRNRVIDAKEAELRRVRERHFLARTPKQKGKCRDDDARLRVEIAELLKGDGWDTATARKLASWNPYDQNASADFFDVEWMFGLTEGFDVSIGNPPYVDSEQMVRSCPELRERLAELYSTTKGNWDLYIPFWEASLKMSNKSRGVVTLITPNKWLSIEYGRALREFTKAKVMRFADYSRFRAFENTGVFPVAVQMSQTPAPSLEIISFVDADTLRFQKSLKRETLSRFDIWGVILSEHFPLIARLVESHGKLSDFCFLDGAFTVSEAYEVVNYLNEVREFDPDTQFKFINTGTIDPFVCLWGLKQTTYIKAKYLRPTISRKEFQRGFPKRFAMATAPKIVVSGMRHFEAYLDAKGECVAGKSTVVVRPKHSSTTMNFVLGILNSGLTKFFLKECYGSLAMDGGISFTTTNTSEIPFPNDPAKRYVDELVRLVKEVVRVTRSDPAKDIGGLQAEVDAVVYALYGLTPEEIKIVEGAGQ